MSINSFLPQETPIISYDNSLTRQPHENANPNEPSIADEAHFVVEIFVNFYHQIFRPGLLLQKPLILASNMQKPEHRRIDG